MVVALGAHDVVGHLGRDTALELLVARQTAVVVGRHDTHSRWPDPEAVHSLGVAICWRGWQTTQPDHRPVFGSAPVPGRTAAQDEVVQLWDRSGWNRGP